MLVNKHWLHESDGILQKEEAPVLKLKDSYTEKWGEKTCLKYSTWTQHCHTASLHQLTLFFPRSFFPAEATQVKVNLAL